MSSQAFEFRSFRGKVLLKQQPCADVGGVYSIVVPAFLGPIIDTDIDLFLVMSMMSHGCHGIATIAASIARAIARVGHRVTRPFTKSLSHSGHLTNSNCNYCLWVVTRS